MEQVAAHDIIASLQGASGFPTAAGEKRMTRGAANGPVDTHHGRGASPHEQTFVAGYTNGYIYYTATEKQRKNKGYAQEDCDSLVAPEWLKLFEERVEAILKKNLEGEALEKALATKTGSYTGYLGATGKATGGYVNPGMPKAQEMSKKLLEMLTSQ